GKLGDEEQIAEQNAEDVEAAPEGVEEDDEDVEAAPKGVAKDEDSVAKDEVAKKIGQVIAKYCLDKGITKLAFECGGSPYHVCLEALAAAAK
ncbi:predicted protein, partial [Arabidopsis lyrata subsp. lyrata]